MRRWTSKITTFDPVRLIHPTKNAPMFYHVLVLWLNSRWGLSSLHASKWWRGKPQISFSKYRDRRGRGRKRGIEETVVSMHHFHMVRGKKGGLRRVFILKRGPFTGERMATLSISAGVIYGDSSSALAGAVAVMFVITQFKTQKQHKAINLRYNTK